MNSTKFVSLTCSKCRGAGWVRGQELDVDPEEELYQYNMNKYTCDWCKGTGKRTE